MEKNFSHTGIIKRSNHKEKERKCMQDAFKPWQNTELCWSVNVIMLETITSGDHGSATIASARKMTGPIQRTFKTRTTKLLRTLVRTLVFLRLEYYSVLNHFRGRRGYLIKIIHKDHSLFASIPKPVGSVNNTWIVSTESKTLEVQVHK